MRRILITGSSGFLGKSLMKRFENSFVDSIGRSESNTIKCDLSHEIPQLNQKYSLVIHAAGKAHMIPKTKEEKEEFFRVNEKGTANLLAALEGSAVPESFVFISSVSVYGLDSGEKITESAPLKGTSPYALSKIRAEELVKNWADRNNVPYLVLRLPLLVGDNPPGNLRDMIQGIKKGRYFGIGEGKARKSMVMADSVAEFIDRWNKKSGTYNLTDGYHPSFRELEEVICAQTGYPKPKRLPMWIAKLAGFAGDIIPGFPVNSNKLKKITSTLTFSDDKAREEQNWNPDKVLRSISVSRK